MEPTGIDEEQIPRDGSEVEGWSSMIAGKRDSEAGLAFADEVTFSLSVSSARGLPSLPPFLCTAAAAGALVLFS